MYPEERDSTKARIHRRSMGGNREASEKVGNSTDDSSKENILGCSKTASNIALRAELGIYSLKTNRGLRKLKWQYRVKKMQRKRLPAIVDRFVWEKRMKGKAGIRWDKVVENIWKEIGGNTNEIMSIEDVGEYKTKVGDMIELREMKWLRQKVDEKTYLHGPLGYAKNLNYDFG